MSFRSALIEHVCISDLQDINVMEMTHEIATKLMRFLTVNMDSLYAAYIPLESVTDRPFNMRCLTAEET